MPRREPPPMMAAPIGAHGIHIDLAAQHAIADAREEREAAERRALLMEAVACAEAACSVYWMQPRASWLDAPELAAGGRADEAIDWT